MKNPNRLASKEDRLKIAQAIRDFMNERGLRRKALVAKPPFMLSEKTVNQVFRGEFTDRTLTAIEALLGSKFRTQNDDEVEQAPTEVGGYTLKSVSSFQGDYLCVRPVFDNPTSLFSYLINISWDGGQLVFKERERVNPKFTHEGTVYIPQNRPFMFLVSSYPGNIRLVTLSIPGDDGLARGIISTISNPKGNIFIPVAAPIFLRRVQRNELPTIGIISSDHPSYADYHATLATVAAEEFGIFVASQDSNERRRAITVINS